MTTIDNKIAIIDIGSNSVRLKIFCGRDILYSQLITSQLSQGISDGKLAYKSIIRTFDAIEQLVFTARRLGAKVYAFATAAVRNTYSKAQFVDDFKKRFLFDLDVLSGEQEAEIGLLGALNQKDGCVLDIGGASTEIAVRQGGDIVYTHSLPIGAVVLTDAFNKDEKACREFLSREFLAYGDIPKSTNYVCVGGTATSLAFIKSGLNEYNASAVHGSTLTESDVTRLLQYFYNTDYNQIALEKHLDLKRARVIHSGAAILMQALKTLNLNQITVSEADNLEGYYYKILGEHSNEK